MAPIPQTISGDNDSISGHDILNFVAMVYHATFMAHPYITGFLLIMWSYHPKAPFQALVYICWTLPKKFLIWTFRLRGFQIGGDTVQPNGHISEATSFTQYQSYGAVSEFSEADDMNSHHEVGVDEVSIWWRLLGMALYLSGLAVMLVYGTLKG